MPHRPPLPPVIGPVALAEALDAATAESLRIIDLRPAEARADGSIPGAVAVDKAWLNRTAPPYGGLMPDGPMLENLLAAIDLREGQTPVAVDAGGATEAARLCWVLHVAGIAEASWLEGGIAGWRATGGPLDTGGAASATAVNSATADATGANPGTAAVPPVTADGVSIDALPADGGRTIVDGVADGFITADALAARLGQPALRIIDVRGAAEYAGTDVRSAEGGHVPGALHYEWTRQFNADGRLRKPDALRDDLEALDVLPEHEVVVYCQSHQRSAVTWRVLTALGYPTVRGLDGAWSVWGNRADLPKER